MARAFNVIDALAIGWMPLAWRNELGRMMSTLSFMSQAGHALVHARRAQWWTFWNVSKYWHSAMLPVLNYGKTESAQRRRILRTRSNEPQIRELQW